MSAGGRTDRAVSEQPVGVLNIDKPPGITSFGVVTRVRRAAGVRRVGHAGTLDPLASGVLVVCLGQATRLISRIQDAPKTYLAGIELGRRTDTYDAEGSVTEIVPVPETLDVTPFIGDIRQTPPVYSALKRHGRPLYDYARRGAPVDVEPRLVRIHSIDIVSWQPPLATLRIRCEKGTYIRSLANDLGGHLVSLVREAVGRFTLADALPLDRLAAWENYLMSIAEAVPEIPRLAVDRAEAARLRRGLRIEGPAGEALALAGGTDAVALVRDGRPIIVFGAQGQ